MKSLKCAATAALLVFALLASRASAQNLFANPGFEDPITFDGAPFVGFWEGFSGGAGASAANSTASPRNGAQNLDLTISGVANTFAGVFQDIPNLVPGQAVTFSGWQRTPGALLLVNEVRIEWRNSVSNTEISRTPNISPPVGATYAEFTLDSIVPAGADSARAVYAIQTFAGDPAHTGTIYIDDASFVVVPEPTSLALLGLGGLTLVRRRRA